MPKKKSERDIFEDELLPLLYGKLKVASWRKKQGIFFCTKNEFFFEVDAGAHRLKDVSVARIAAKPMSLDPAYWRIVDLEENNNEPLSFRAWGAFTCSSIPIDSIEIPDSAKSPADISAELSVAIERSTGHFAGNTTEKQFIDIVASNPNQIERGSYAITYVMALYCAGEQEKALEVATAYTTGERESSHAHNHLGENFHTIAVRHIQKELSA